MLNKSLIPEQKTLFGYVSNRPRQTEVIELRAQSPDIARNVHLACQVLILAFAVPIQYPGEFVPTILWIGGVAAGWFTAHEARIKAAPAAQRIVRERNRWRFINETILCGSASM